MVPLQMELGGKDVCIVCADADIALAARHIVKGGFSYSGQRCTAVKLVMAAREVADALVAQARARRPLGIAQAVPAHRRASSLALVLPPPSSAALPHPPTNPPPSPPAPKTPTRGAAARARSMMEANRSRKTRSVTPSRRGTFSE